MSLLPTLVRDVEPNAAVCIKLPVTSAPPAPSAVMLSPESSYGPPIRTAHWTVPPEPTRATKTSSPPALVRDVEPNATVPPKIPVTSAPPAPSEMMLFP
eukprot:2715818-Prymnesium_polylepis.1